MAWPGRVAAVLAHPRLPWLAALLGMLLASPALAQGLQLDDHLHRAWVELVLRGDAPGPWWDLFAVARDPESNRQAMELGASPWWMLPELRIRFLRPLSAATHVVDYGLWPSVAWLMHAQSLLWYGALVVGVGALLRRWLGPTWVAGLATLMFAVDDAHAIPVSWIAQRNALIAAVLVVGMLWAHDRARRDDWRTGRWLAPLLFAGALLAGESAVGGLGYLVAHALWLEPRPSASSGWAPRLTHALRVLVPYAAVVIVWRAAYSALGYGAFGSGVYVDPGLEPAAFASVLPERLAALGAGQLTWIDAEAWAFAPHPWATPPRVVLIVGLALVLAAAPWLRREPGLRVCLAGAALALVPAATAIPSDRLLLLCGIGTSAALAAVVAIVVGEGMQTPRRWRRRGLAILLAGPIVVIHGVVAPVQLTQRIIERGRALDRAGATTIEGLPSDPELATQTLVIVDAPPTFNPASLWLDPGQSDRVLPRRLRVLGSTFGPVIVRRVGARALELQPVGGYLGDPFTTVLRGPAHPLRPGDRVELDRWRVEVLGVVDGRPTVVRVELDEPFDDPSLRWITWGGERFVPYAPPPVGGAAPVPR